MNDKMPQTADRAGRPQRSEAEGLRTTVFDIPRYGQAGDVRDVVAANSSVVILRDVDLKTPRALPESVLKKLQD